MKVPDINKKSDDINDITQYRKKKKRMKLARNLLIALTVCILAAVVWVYRDIIFEPLRGIASKITTTTNSSQGFPIEVSSGSDCRLLPMGDNFLLLTDTYLYTYNMGGGQNFALQHGYVTPCADSNDKRVLIYDRGGHDFALYSKTSEIFKQSIEDEVIVSAFVSDNETVAVVTSGGRYSNVIYVYDGNGKWIYTRKFIDENIMQAAFSPDGKYLYVTSIVSDSGNIVTKVCKYDISSDENELWKSPVSDSIPLGITVSSDKVTVACDNMMICFDSESGAEKGRFTFNGDIVSFDVGKNIGAVVIDNYTGTENTLVVLDEKCAETARTDKYPDIASLQISDDDICFTSASSVILCDSGLKEKNRVPTDDEFSGMLKIGSSVLLMGYDTISCKSL